MSGFHTSGLRAFQPEGNRKRVIRTTPEIWRTPCDGCRHLECIRQDKSKLHPWRYYCTNRSASVDPHRVDCHENDR